MEIETVLSFVNKPVQTEWCKDHMQLIGMKRWFQKMQVGMMEERKKRRNLLSASQRSGLAD